MTEELEALAILSSIPLLGAVKIKALIERYGSAKAALLADAGEIACLPGFGPLAQNWGCWKTDTAWRRNLDLAHKIGVQLIPYTSPAYPRHLLEIPDHPIMLYVQGEIKPEDAQSIAIVGTRQASIYGMETAGRFSEGLATQGFTIISGLARGIDTAAHQGALSRGRTLAVMGSGLANIYPQENRRLAAKIAEQGALISEFPMQTPPDKQNFPQRNRIVAGMSLGSLLIEAPYRSGAMLTLERARRYGRPCFAIPGRIDQENFAGNHALIKRGYAKLVTEYQEVTSSFEELFVPSPTISAPMKSACVLEPEERNFLDQLPNEELTIEEIIGITKLSMMKLNVLLMRLLIKRALREYPGKIYKKIV